VLRSQQEDDHDLTDDDNSDVSLAFDHSQYWHFQVA
jgi:hypothetical protein